MAVPGVKQVSRGWSQFQGGAPLYTRPSTIQVTTAPQNTRLTPYYQNTVSGAINQQPIYTPQATTTFTEPTPDPAAEAAARAEAARLQGVRDTTQTGTNNKYSAYGIKYGDFGNQYERDFRDWVTGYTGNQNTINNNLANNALNLRRGMASIADGIRQGIRSGGVQLANMNATTSGAAEALARAFAKQGNSQFNNINNEAQLESSRLGNEQINLNQLRTDKLYDFDVWGDSTLNNYNTELGQELDYLNSNASAQGVQGAVDYSQRGQLYNQARQRIDAIDAAMQGRLAGVRGMTPEEINAKAAEMDVAGMAGYNPFRLDFNTAVTPGNGVGANPGQLPIYTVPRPDDEYYA